MKERLQGAYKQVEEGEAGRSSYKERLLEMKEINKELVRKVRESERRVDVMTGSAEKRRKQELKQIEEIAVVAERADDSREIEMKEKIRELVKLYRESR